MTRLIGTVLRQTRNWFLNEVPRRSPWNFASLCHHYSIANDGNICSNIIDIDSSFSENDKQKILEFKVEVRWKLHDTIQNYVSQIVNCSYMNGL